MTSDIIWGPEIRVDGKRPEWLGDDVPVSWKHVQMCGWFGESGCYPANSLVEWRTKVVIRLPADDPHYATPTPATAPSRGEVGTEVVERMVRHLRGVIAKYSNVADPKNPELAEARAIVALLPEPVDGEEERARDFLKDLWWDDHGDGRFDRVVKFAAEQVARGRALEKGDRS